MGNAKPSKRVSVCLLSSRTLTLNQLRKQPWARQFRLYTLRLPAPVTLRRLEFSLPRTQVCVIDSLPTSRATQALVAKVAEKAASVRLLVIGKGFSKSDSCELLRLGVRGLLTYDQIRKQLPRAIARVAAGGYWAPRATLFRFATTIVQSARLNPAAGMGVYLSRREREVYEAILANLSNKEIADKLYLSLSMVKTYVGNVLAKFGVQRRVDLLLLNYQSSTLEGKYLGHRTRKAS